MLQRSITVVRIRGIPIRIHVSLVVFLPYWVASASYQFSAVAARSGVAPSALGLPSLVWGGILAIGLAIAILLHELAHSFVALRDGARIEAITLTMLGGVSEIRDEVAPGREAWMALAGPLTSAGIAIVSFAVHRLLPLPPGASVAWLLFAWTNGALAVFNLLPAYPMDGGRVLRGLLARRMGRRRATRVATTVGRVVAVLLALAGVALVNVVMVLVAGFVYWSATAERERLRATELLRHVPASMFLADQTATALAVASDDAAIRDNRPTIHERDNAARAFELLSTGDVDAVVVMDSNEKVLGLITVQAIEQGIDRLMAGAAARDPGSPR